jgi:hypothetical protein
VETYHPAEHALQFVGPRAVVRLELDPGGRTCADSGCGFQVGFATNCWDRSAGAETPRVVVRIVYRDPAGADSPVAVTLECTTAGGSLRFCVGDFELGLVDPGGGTRWPVSGLILESTMDGCIVDDVVLERFFLFCGA